MENNLLYVITMMLKDEINKLDNINQVDNFLENSKCGFLLEELQKMPDIQIFFKKVIQKTVEIIERTSSSREIKFNIEEKQKELIDSSINYSKEENSKKIQERNDEFQKEYSPNININDIKNLCEKAEKQENYELFHYYKKIENDINSNDNIYSNQIIMKKMFDTNSPIDVLTLYQNDFLEIVSFIKQILEDLKNNILLLPNSIKYICKIISILIKKKFKDIIKTEENAFISKFLIEKLLIPIISFPSFNALINDFVISRNTLKNIKVLNFILKKLFSGKLFINNEKEYEYTPFNWLFLDKINNVLLFFNKVINVNLPDFIEKYINDKLPNDYEYDYFNENKDQIYASISISFSINNLVYLLKGLEKSNDLFQKKNEKIEKLSKTIKMISIDEIKTIDQNLINDIINKLAKKNDNNNDKDKDKNKDKDKDKIEIIYIYNDEIIEKKYKNLFSINNKIANFYIKKDGKDTKLNEKEKNIINVKNYLCSSLGNYRLLNKSDFNIGTTSNTIKMLEEIKTYMSLPNFILNNNTIPSIWYINSILDYINKIPDDYKEKDYKKLFEELTENLNDSIKMLDFEKLILFRNKLKFIDKIKDYYTKVKELIDDIKINEKIKEIVEKEFIPVDIIFKYGNTEKKFELRKSNNETKKLLGDKIIYVNQKSKYISLRTIEAFTTYFPNLTKYQLLQDINPLKIIKELSINERINDYLEIIKEKIRLMKNESDKNNKNINYEDKIRDYIMNKIYEKIYPPEFDDKDNEIYKKASCLFWLEPISVVGKDYIYDNLMPDISNEFEQINIAKTPDRKYKCILKIMEYVKSLIKFNEGLDKEIGEDDITPVLTYVFIKANPLRIFTDLEFIKIFLNKKDDPNIVNIEKTYYYLLESKPKDFNITEEEYRKKVYGYD